MSVPPSDPNTAPAAPAGPSSQNDAGPTPVSPSPPLPGVQPLSFAAPAGPYPQSPYAPPTGGTPQTGTPQTGYPYQPGQPYQAAPPASDAQTGYPYQPGQPYQAASSASGTAYQPPAAPGGYAQAGYPASGTPYPGYQAAGPGQPYPPTGPAYGPMPTPGTSNKPNRAAPILVIGGGLVVVIAVVALVVGLWHGHSTPAPAALATTSQTAQAGHTASASAQPADTATDQPTAPSQTAAPTATGGATATTTAQPAPAGTESVDPATGCPKVVSMFDSGYTGETPYRDPSKLSAFQTTACLTSAITDLKKYSNTNAVGDEVWAVVSIRDDDAFYRVRQDSSKYWWFCVRGDSLDDCIKDDNDGRFDTMVPFHLSDIDPAAMGKVLALAPQRIAAKGLTGVTDIRLSVTAAKADAGGAAVAPASAITLRLQIEAANGNDTSKYTVTGAPKP